MTRTLTPFYRRNAKLLLFSHIDELELFAILDALAQVFDRDPFIAQRHLLTDPTSFECPVTGTFFRDVAFEEILSGRRACWTFVFLAFDSEGSEGRVREG